MRKLLMILLGSGVLFSAGLVHAAGGEGWAIGANLGFINSDQSAMNDEINAMNAQDSAGVATFGNAWEVNAMIAYRFSGATALMLRPSYFYYKAETGTGTSGDDYEYQLTGFTLFPMLRFHMLEDQSIKFYSQFGVGYGHMNGTINEGAMEVDFSGGTLGYLMGLGAEFCFAGGSHCLNVEGNVRFLAVDRMLVDSSSGSIPAGSRLTNIDKTEELEIDDRDFSATMSGVLGMIGYTLHF